MIILRPEANKIVKQIYPTNLNFFDRLSTMRKTMVSRIDENRMKNGRIRGYTKLSLKNITIYCGSSLISNTTYCGKNLKNHEN